MVFVSCLSALRHCGSRYLAFILLLNLFVWTVASAVQAQSSSAVISVNTGGGAAGSFSADGYYSGGNTDSVTSTITTSGVINPAPQAVYQSERWGNSTYTLPGLLPNGSYTVRLHFAETYYGPGMPGGGGTGSRQFNAFINGAQVLTNFDIFAAAGGADIAIVKTYPATADSNGNITLVFTQGVADNPKISGIEVFAAAPAPPTALAATASNASVALSWSAPGGAVTGYNIYRSTTSGIGYTAVNASAVTATSYTDIGVTNGTTYYYVVTAINSAGESAYSNQASATPSSQPAVALLSINAGGGTAGSFAADEFVQGGSTDTQTAAINTSGVTNPAPQAVYQSERWGNSFTYTLPGLTPGSSYTVRLHFAETFYGLGMPGGGGIGSRKFNASINGAQVLYDFDISRVTGGANIAVAESYPATADANGNITVAFTQGSASFPKVDGIEVFTAPLTPTPAATLAVNAGGGAAGNFAADEYYSGGTAYSYGAGTTITTSGVANPAPQAVYQTERWGNFTYTLPGLTPGASYPIRLHFAELAVAGPTARLFNVLINGMQVLTSFDIFAEAGGQNIAIVKSFPATADANGNITITFTQGSANFPKVSGIEILAPTSTTTPVSTPTSIVVSPASATLSTNGTQQFTAVAYDQNGNMLSPQPTFSWSASSGIGSISSTGLYTAGTTAGSDMVTATSGTLSGTAAVSVISFSLSVNPSAVTGGQPATGVVTLASPALSPVTMTLGCVVNNSAASVQSSVTIPAGSTFATFPINTIAVSTLTTATVSATYRNATLYAPLSIAAPSSTLATISVSPGNAVVLTGGTQQFSATALDQNGSVLPTQPAFTWTVSGGGTISSATGLFTAGSSVGGPYTVTATALGQSGNASVLVETTGNTTSPLTPFTTIKNTKWTIAGYGGMRYYYGANPNFGTGSILVSGISGTVTKAYLYWHGPTNSTNPTANATVTFNGTSVTGTNIGFASDNGWGYLNSQAYRADVTALVNGNATYSLSNFVKGAGLAGGGTQAIADINGVTLVTFFNDGTSTGNRDVTIFDGNDSNKDKKSDGKLEWNDTFPNINWVSGTTTNIWLGISDTQNAEDAAIVINGNSTNPLVPQGFDFNGSSVPEGGSVTGCRGGLWDIETYNLTPFLSSGENTVNLVSPLLGDYLSLVYAIIDQPSLSSTQTTASPPTVAMSAAASPNPVSGTATNLSVLGADANGEVNLTYMWRIVGVVPGPVSLSLNGNNAAKNTVATFTQAGTYTFQVTIQNSSGLTATSSVSVVVSQTLSKLTVTPTAAKLPLNGTQQFSATATDQFGKKVINPSAISWSVLSGQGNINASGLYNAGSTAGTATIQVGSGTFTATAIITVVNTAPTIGIAASANPNPVTGTTTTLSVLGVDDGGESNLTYTWATTGTPPAAVSFSINGTNAAKNTVATFTQPGTYNFRVTITDAGGLSVTSGVTVTVTVSQTLTKIVIWPNPVSLNVGGSQQFTAVAYDQNGNMLSPQPTFSWSASSGIGSISSTGLYSAGTTAGSDTVTATSGNVSGTANVTVIAPTPNPLWIDAGSATTYTDAKTYVWSADQDFLGGATTSTTAAIAGTTDPALYQTQRTGASFTYTIPVANGNYILSLLFAETQGYTAGQRTFTVTADSQTLLSNFDIFAAAGANAALVKNFTVPVTNGQLTLTFTGNIGSAAVAALQLIPIPATGGIIYGVPGGSQAAPDIPAPGWAEDVLPTDDSSDADGMGPSMAGPVNTASGVEENSPSADLWAYNPIGPSVSYSRMYRSARAVQGYGSPGLSPGWVDEYDQSITITGSTYTRVYPNGATEVWGGTTGTLTPPPGAPYTVVQTVAKGNPSYITVTNKDRSREIFTQIATTGGNYPAGTYLLAQVTNLVGRSIYLNRDASANGYRVFSITNDAYTPVDLLTFTYNGNLLSAVSDAYSRKVSYGFTNTSTGINLSAVSQIAASGAASPPTRWGYGYTPSAATGEPLLTQVQAPNPASPGTLASTYTDYYDTGAVAEHIDATGRIKSYFYNGGQTQIQADNADGSLAQSWTQKQDVASKNQDAGIIDAKNKATSILYTGTPSPYLPNAEVNRNGQTSSITYNDSYGNPQTVTSPRNVVTTFTYGNPADFALNQVASIQESILNGTSPGDTKQPTNFSYYGPDAGTINGLLKTVSSPQPDSTVANPGTAVVTTYNYDTLGNVTSMTTPNANGTATVSYNYTADGTFTQTEALGEPLTVTVSGPDAYGGTTTATTHYRYDTRGNCITVVDPSGNETDFAYNLADQLTDTLYPATNDSDSTNSGTGRSKTSIAYQYLGGPDSTTTVYDESGNMFRQVSNVYDAEGEVLSVQGNTYPVQYVYDGRGRVKSMTYYGQAMSNANTTYYDYDTVGNLADIRYPGQTGANYDKLQYFYDADSNLIEELDGIGLEKDYQRYDPTTNIADPESLLRTIHYVYPSGYTGSKIGDVAFTYDHYGRRASITSQNPTTSTSYITQKMYGYDDLDNLTSLTTNFGYDSVSDQQPVRGQSLTFVHNSDGSRAVLAPSTGDNQDYYYDGLGRTILTYLPYSGFGSSYSYQTNGWLTQRQVFYDIANQAQAYLETDWTYNPRGFVTTLKNSLLTNATLGTASRMLSSFSGSNPAATGSPRMTYDPDGNRLQELATVPAYASAEDLSRMVSYQYDGFDELTQEMSQVTTGPPSLNYTNTFAYDLSGNPTTSNRLEGSGFNADNQNTSVMLSNSTAQTITYNGNGDPLFLSYAGANLNYTPPTYDPEDRLTLTDQGNMRVTYDGDGLRTWNYVGLTGSPSYYLFDGSSAVLETDGQSNGPADELSFNVYGPDGLTGRMTATDSYVADTFDPQGNAVQPISFYPNGSSSVVHITNSMAFDAFGGYQGFTAQGPGHSTAAYDPVGFGGQFGYYHDFTGRYLLGHRYYDSYTGRFLTRDPIGYSGGLNLYGFTGNNPVNESDPSGYQADEYAEDATKRADTGSDAPETTAQRVDRLERRMPDSRQTERDIELNQRFNKQIYGMSRADINAFIKSLDRQAARLNKIERSEQPSRPQYNNPGHHEPGRPNYDPEKDILPKDASQVYKGAITLDGRMYYGKNAAGDIYRYSPESDAGIGSGYRHWSGSTGTPRGLPDTPNQIYKRLGVKRR